MVPATQGNSYTLLKLFLTQSLSMAIEIVSITKEIISTDPIQQLKYHIKIIVP